MTSQIILDFKNHLITQNIELSNLFKPGIYDDKVFEKIKEITVAIHELEEAGY